MTPGIDHPNLIIFKTIPKLSHLHRWVKCKAGGCAIPSIGTQYHHRSTVIRIKDRFIIGVQPVYPIKLLE